MVVGGRWAVGGDVQTSGLSYQEIDLPFISVSQITGGLHGGVCEHPSKTVAGQLDP